LTVAHQKCFVGAALCGRIGSVLVCVECGRVADDEAVGWRAYREDPPDEDDPPSLAIFCRNCAAREFDAEPAA
jgi:hypothetical protein